MTRLSLPSIHRISRKTRNHVRVMTINTLPCRLNHYTQSKLLRSQFMPSWLLRSLSSRAQNQLDHAAAPAQEDISIEMRYSRKNPIEHILLRPGMYVGPTERLAPTQTWVLDSHDSSSSTPILQIVQKHISHIPALLKIFDEILVNASDNALRVSPCPTTRIDVVLHPGGGNLSTNKDSQSTHAIPSNYIHYPYISIRNNGSGIPVAIHRKEGLYVPELLFGHLLTGSNFDDGESTITTTLKTKNQRANKRITGGRHGYGAKLTNIFSTWFEVETLDLERGKLYRQVWENNMSIKHEPVIINMDRDISSSTDEGYTKVTFVPDMKQLWRNPNNGDYAIGPETKQDSSACPSILPIPHEDLALMRKRVYDIAACSGDKVRVTLNGELIPVQSFLEYVQLFRGSNSSPVIFDEANKDWDVGVGLSKSGSFEQVSFVNCMATTRGGSHVDVIVQKIVDHLIQEVSKLQPDLAPVLSPSLVKRCLSVFVNSFIENPSFDSQMKEALTSSPDSFGTNYNLSESFLQQIIQDEVSTTMSSDENNPNTTGGPGIKEELIRLARGRLQSHILKELSKRSRRSHLSIEKLDDAHYAGTDKGHLCTLILTEGDSAKAFAVAGLEKMGRDLYGIFPLRGKFLNVREASTNQLSTNTEVKALFSILGLRFDCKYETNEERLRLRYGHVMLMTDQDTDGSHIKGLILNFFRHFWPCLLKPAVDDMTARPFLSSFITPLLKAQCGKRDTLNFFSLSDYNNWKASLPQDTLKKWTVKYYKGLGTNTHAEAKEYFNDFPKYHRPFRWESEEDGKFIDMLFDKDRSDDRKKWMIFNTKRHHAPPQASASIDDSVRSITYQNFINTEMIEYSSADNIRSLPSVIDGLKPSQRKVLYACFKRKLKNEIKVAQLSGYCAEHTSYHHGEASLHATIIGMAQDFVGATNINLLHPAGQFGTRLAGGADAASPRYIFTYLSPLSRLIFPEVDDDLLEYLDEDGQKIEPKCYYPIIPLILCNGSQGIGTGWSTYIPPHSPRDVLEFVRAKLNETTPPLIKPWVRGFKGRIDYKEDKTGYRTTGLCEKISNKSVLISELPAGRWTNDYKGYLYKLKEEGKIIDFKENHTTSSVSFIVNFKAAELERIKEKSLEKFFKLESHLPLTNMHAFDSSGIITKYNSPEDIFEAYFPQRLKLYRQRKLMLERNCEYLSTVLSNKVRFIEMFVEGKINLARGTTTKADTIGFLKDQGYTSKNDLDKIRFIQGASESKNTDSPLITPDDVEVQDGSYDDFDYLLNLPLASLTSDRIDSLSSEKARAQETLNNIQDMSAEDLWRIDLDRLSTHL